jgi:hypothetical protein
MEGRARVVLTIANYEKTLAARIRRATSARVTTLKASLPRLSTTFVR